MGSVPGWDSAMGDESKVAQCYWECARVGQCNGECARVTQFNGECAHCNG